MSREQDRLFIRNFMAVLAALVGVTLVLIIAVNIAFDESQEGPTAVERERAAQRLQPVGQVRVAPAQRPAAPAAGSAPSEEPAAEPPAPEQTTTQPRRASQAASGDAGEAATADGSAAEPSAASSGPPGDGSQGQAAKPAQSGGATAEAPAAGDGVSSPEQTAANTGQASQAAPGDAAGGNGDATATPAEPATPAGQGASAPQQPAAEASSAAPPAEDLAAGRALTEGMCNVCHANQFLNSPQVGDPTAWKPRLNQDLATLVRHVQNGYGNMPPQAAFGTREEIRKAILWMVEEKTGLEVKR